MGRTEREATDEAKNMEVCKRKWTGEDVWFLTENAGKLSVAEISEKLGRTQNAVSGKAFEFGLSLSVRKSGRGAKKIRNEWTKEDVRYLTAHAGTVRSDVIAKNLGRSKDAVKHMAYKLGIKLGLGLKSGPEPKSKTIPGGTLCWRCKRAGTLNPAPPCAWVRAFKPVVGWTATKTESGYHVFACPVFIERGGLRGGA
jgi:hypothetical protein